MVRENLLEGKQHLHFIGIGGSGMFALVQILHDKGYFITGSDNNESDIVRMERAMGICVNLNQNPANLTGADLIVYTIAVLPDNPELIAARKSNVPLVERSVMLGYLTSLYSDCVCISGTHGKTTTSSMLTEILLGAKMDPTAVIGGKLKSINSYGRVGNSDIMVCEACEFAEHFLALHPDISVILNIDNDHLDYFKTFDRLQSAFESFGNLASKCIIYNGDNAAASQAVSFMQKKRTISFGFSNKNDYYPADIEILTGIHTRFSLNFHGQKLAELNLFVPGKHNILNAVAACAAALEVGTPINGLAKGLANFKGAGRRFELIGVKNQVTIVDDYAHHPTEIAATLRAAKELTFHEVWVLHQPFTYSRTKMLMDDFAKALSLADHVVLTEIMGSREKNTLNVYAKDLADKIEGCLWFCTQKQAADYVINHAKQNDLVVTMGCGDVYKAAKMMAFGAY